MLFRSVASYGEPSVLRVSRTAVRMAVAPYRSRHQQEQGNKCFQLAAKASMRNDDDDDDDDDGDDDEATCVDGLFFACRFCSHGNSYGSAPHHLTKPPPCYFLS